MDHKRKNLQHDEPDGTKLFQQFFTVYETSIQP